MSYENPYRQKYGFYFDAGNNGNETWSIKGPLGKAGRLRDWGVEGVTEAFTADATLSVGTAADPDAFGEEIAFGVVAVDTMKSFRTLYAIGSAGSTALIGASGLDIPADTLVQLTLVDDAAAGMGVFFMVIDWQD